MTKALKIFVCLFAVMSISRIDAEESSPKSLANTSVSVDDLLDDDFDDLSLDEYGIAPSSGIGGDIIFHGFVSQGMLYSTGNNWLANSTDGSLEFNELGVNFRKQLREDVHLGMQLFSRDLGAMGNNKVIVDWAFADYRWRDWCGLRIGKVKLAVGLQNETRDIDMTRVQTLLSQGVYMEQMRDVLNSALGASVYGDIDLRTGGSLAYNIQFGVPSLTLNSAITSLVEESDGLDDIDRVEGISGYNISLQYLTPLDGLKFGVSSMGMGASMKGTGSASWGPLEGKDATAEFDLVKLHVGSIEYMRRDLTMVFEYSTMTAPMRLVELNFDMMAIRSVSYYLSADYRFNSWFSAGLTYDVFFNDIEDMDGEKTALLGNEKFTAWQKDIVLSTRFDVSQNWVVKFESHFIDGVAHTNSWENIGDPMTGEVDYEQNWQMFLVKTTFSF